MGIRAEIARKAELKAHHDEVCGRTLAVLRERGSVTLRDLSQLVGIQPPQLARILRRRQKTFRVEATGHERRGVVLTVTLHPTLRSN